VPYLSASAVVIHYEEALLVYAPLPYLLPLTAVGYNWFSMRYVTPGSRYEVLSKLHQKL